MKDLDANKYKRKLDSKSKVKKTSADRIDALEAKLDKLINLLNGDK